MDAFGRLDGAFTLEILKRAPFPKDILALGAEGLKRIWHEAKLRGRGYAKADGIIRQAEKSVGLTDGSDAGREAVRWFAEKTAELMVELAGIESTLHELHVYYTTRAGNPLKKMQSLIAIACKLLRMIYTILKTGRTYDPEKMLKDIRIPETAEGRAA